MIYLKHYKTNIYACEYFQEIYLKMHKNKFLNFTNGIFIWKEMRICERILDNSEKELMHIKFYISLFLAFVFCSILHNFRHLYTRIKYA